MRLSARLLTLLAVWSLAACGRSGVITVGSKNFTESVILGEIVAQRLERAGFAVDRRFNLGGTFICHEAIVNGQIDIYVEYTGTALAAVLELPMERNRERVRALVDSAYRDRWGLQLGEPFGFNNTFAMLVRSADARRLEIKTLSDAVPHSSGWTVGVGYEFMERADGYRGLVDAYGFTFGTRPRLMDLGLTYRALSQGQVDIIAGNSTDGQIDALDLIQLEDDRRYFPPYEAVPIVRSEVVRLHPDVVTSLEALAGAIDERLMRALNRAVDVEGRDASRVVDEMLTRILERPRL